MCLVVTGVATISEIYLSICFFCLYLCWQLLCTWNLLTRHWSVFCVRQQFIYTIYLRVFMCYLETVLHNLYDWLCYTSIDLSVFLYVVLF